MATNLILTLDQADADYAPGETVNITTTNLAVGGTLTFNVDHVLAGLDGILGTADDTLAQDLTGTGTSWTVIDGGAGDLDGIANGTIVTSWLVGLDAVNQAFVLSATDTTTSATATTMFTDKAPVVPIDFAYAATHIDLTATSTLITQAGLTWANEGTSLASTASSGTGNFGTFVEIQNSPAEQGYNTSDNNALDGKNSDQFNAALKLSDLQKVDATGTPSDTGTFYEFKLDLHENNSAPYLSLDGLQFWQSITSNLDHTHVTAGADTQGSPPSFSLSDATKVYDLNDPANETGGLPNSVLLNSLLTAGSGGGDDLVVLVPTSFFDSLKGDYVYLYSAFGFQGIPDDANGHWDSDATFEEWGALLKSTVPNPAISIEKDIVCPDGDLGPFSADDPSNPVKLLKGDGTVAYQIVVTNQGNVALTNPQVTDDLLTLGTPVQTGGLGDHTDNILDVGETWTYMVSGAWGTGGPNTNTAEVKVSYGGVNLDEKNSASYFGLDPHITLTKLTNGSDTADLLAGQAITWTYDVKNDGNVDLTGLNVTDNPTQQIDPVLSGGFNSGDTNHDGKLTADDPTTADVNEAETWHYTATGKAVDTSGIVGGKYTNTATATTDDVTDACNDSAPVTDDDGSGYTGHAVATEGLTKGYWATHATLWDVITTDSGGTDLNPCPGYDWNHSGGITKSTVVTSGSASSKGLVVSGSNNGSGDSGLLMGDLNHDGLVTGDGSSGHLFFDLASAQALANSSVSGDARIILAGQAVAAQLNEYADYVKYGADTSPNGLINEAVRWLAGDTSFALSANGHSNVNTMTANDIGGVPTVINDGTTTTNDYTLSGGAITLKGTALSSSDASWQTKAQVFSEATAGFDVNGDTQLNDTVWANGEGLKNALAAYNHGLSGTTAGFVVSQDGSTIGWENSIGGTPTDVHPNAPDAFWGILANQGITGVEWHLA